MSRVINYQSSGKQRTQLTKAIVVALRELARQKSVTDEARDLAAFISLALQAIAAGIDSTVAAWERRDYWVKADKFRMEWAWAQPTANEMRQAVLSEDWATIARLAAHIAQKLSKVRVSENARSGKPWKGAFQELRK
ncbi:MAG: hypothetical protein ABIN58_10450 [candidate division WOR-3 bacterium]